MMRAHARSDWPEDGACITHHQAQGDTFRRYEHEEQWQEAAAVEADDRRNCSDRRKYVTE